MAFKPFLWKPYKANATMHGVTLTPWQQQLSTLLRLQIK